MTPEGTEARRYHWLIGSDETEEKVRNFPSKIATTLAALMLLGACEAGMTETGAPDGEFDNDEENFASEDQNAGNVF